MKGRITANSYRTTIVCVDSYRTEVFKGRIFNPYFKGPVKFDSLMQLILRIEDLLDRMHFPQPFDESRAFASVQSAPPEVGLDSDMCVGEKATFAVRIIFRQNASWQGSVTWLEKGREESFRSALELFLLMHSALKSDEAVLEEAAT